jgi:DNA-directed RNA polymerase subunit RPC12/RpoP
MEIIFKCQHCEQELQVAESGAGSEIQCPTCGQTIVIPQPNHRDAVLRPGMSNAARLEEKHFVVPQHQTPADALITKPLRPLEVAATDGIHLSVKTIRHSECVEVGRDHFDEVVTKFLNKIGEAHIVAMHPVTYAHQDVGSHHWVNDYGLMVIYRG